MRTVRKLLAPGAVILLAGLTVAACSGSDEGKDRGGQTEPPADVPLNVSGHSNIYVMNMADRSVKRITNYTSDTFATDPSWSARGGIAFSEAPANDFARLFLIRPDGSTKREVPTRVTHLFHPTWSPDATEVAVVRLAKGIYAVNPRTGAARRLPNTGEFDNSPVWSPDGKSIMFERQVRSTNLDLYLVSAAGGELRRLTRDPLQQTNAAWSPDGSKVVFSEQQKTGNWALVSMRLDGSDRKRLTDPDLSIQEPSWSPDGRKIACVLQEGDRASVAVIDAAGGDPVRISSTSLVASHPIWSPDGRRIAFSAQTIERPAPSAPPGAHG